MYVTKLISRKRASLAIIPVNNTDVCVYINTYPSFSAVQPNCVIKI